MEDEKIVKVWNVPLKDGSIIRAATIENTGRTPLGMCEGCFAICCKNLLPILNEDEFRNKKFDCSFSFAPKWLKIQVPRANYIVHVKGNPKRPGCPYHDWETNSCSIWPDCPKSCLDYDCRLEPRQELKEFSIKREKEWREQLRPT